jgi:hypothetical protein
MLTTKDKSQKNKPASGTMPKGSARRRTSKEEMNRPNETEAGTQREGADATFTERNDVTPPNRKEFPSVGNAKTDFESRPLGRTTGRMIGHEPGTEGI